MPKLTERRDGTAFRDYLERWKPSIPLMGTLLQGYALHSWSREPGGLFNGQSLYRIHEEYRKPTMQTKLVDHTCCGRGQRRPTEAINELRDFALHGNAVATAVGMAAARDLTDYIAHLEQHARH